MSASVGDPSLLWQSYENQFQGQRLLTSAERTWLALLTNPTASTVSVTQIRYRASITLDPVEQAVSSVPVAPMRGTAEQVFSAPVVRRTPNVSQTGIVVEQSGQTLKLPELTPLSVPNLAFIEAVQGWLSRDLTFLIQRVMAVQQETGWSDYEVVKLVGLYSATSLSPDQQNAFLTSFWKQAGFNVQLARAGEQWVVLLACRAVSDWPLYVQNGYHWLALSETSASDLTFTPGDWGGKTQSVRWVSQNHRAATNDFTSVGYQVPTANRTVAVSLSIPSHWAHIALRPATIETRFNEPFPDYLFDQVQSLWASEDVLTKTRRFASWLKMDFSQSEMPVSIQQGFLTKQLSQESRLVLMTRWWRHLTGRNVAVVEQANARYLALQLPNELDLPEALPYRRKSWWIWSADLTQVSDISSSAQWSFLP
ncbi:hypothetical protein [Reinekea sp. G2M2-21]|uniref:hypothetical protein n=1 Tax=Reinekea sp. G2M2-21 TaxID=2788942 RepID=UPI0018A91691|nr:hypothetical protein [Reinekea sp. G2M2-21]